MDMDIIIPLLNSILTGSLYSLMALGLTLTYSIIRFPNFAHGEFITIGAYIAVLFSIIIPLSSILNLHPILTSIIILIISAIITGICAVVTHLIIYRPLINRGSKLVYLMIASLAVSIIIRYLIYIFVDIGRTFYKLYLFNILPKMYFGETIKIAGFSLTPLFQVSVFATILLVFLLQLLLTKTKLGKAMRAVANNSQLAAISGIDISRITMLAWFISGSLTGLAGVLWANYVWATPTVGQKALLSIFAASIIGGLTSFSGTVIGGYILGFSENLLLSFLNQWFNVSLSYKPMVSFMIVVIVLITSPKGIAGINLRKIILKIRKR